MQIEAMPGMAFNTTFTFSEPSENKPVTLSVTKNETADCTYRLGIKYLGPDEDNRPQFKVLINGEMPCFKPGKPFTYHGSNSMKFTPEDADTLCLEKTDEASSEQMWLDITRKPYIVSGTPPLSGSAAAIKAMVEKAKVFTPEDNKTVRKIFYNGRIGVLIYARDNNWQADIYMAKAEDESFVKTNAHMYQQCKCPTGDSWWNVEIPGDSTVHKMEFPQGFVGAYGHGSGTTWDGAP